MRYDWDYGIPDKYTVVDTGRGGHACQTAEEGAAGLAEEGREVSRSEGWRGRTPRQQTALCEAEYVLEIVEQFIKYGLIKEDKKERI